MNQKVEMNFWIWFLLKWIDWLKWIFDLKIVKVYWLIEIKIGPNGSFKGEQFWIFWEKWIDWLLWKLDQMEVFRKDKLLLQNLAFTRAEKICWCYKNRISFRKGNLASNLALSIQDGPLALQEQRSLLNTSLQIWLFWK